MTQPTVVDDWVGIACASGAATAWGCYIVFARRLGRQTPGQALALTMCIGALASLPAGASAVLPHVTDPAVIAVGLCVATLSSVLPYSLQLHSLRYIPAHTFSVLLSLEPAVGAAVGLVFLDQRLGPLAWCGIAAVVVASVFSSQRRATRRRRGVTLTTRAPHEPRRSAPTKRPEP